MEERRIVLIDGDEKIYQAAHASQKVSYDILTGPEEEPELVINFKYSKEAKAFVDFNPDKGYRIERKVTPEEDWIARYNMETLIKSSLEVVGTRDYSVYLSGPTNFRNTIATLEPYKGSRPEEKPYHYQFLKDHLLEEHFAVVVDDMEADDALGIMSTMYTSVGYYTPVIDSQDKDLRMIPGLWYDKHSKQVSNITTAEGHRSFFRQLLTGDTTDDIPGIVGIGPGRALSAIPNDLEDPLKMLEVCRQLWAKAVKDGKVKSSNFSKEQIKEMDYEQVMLEVGRLLWIKRYRDQIWSPEIYND